MPDRGKQESKTRERERIKRERERKKERKKERELPTATNSKMVTMAAAGDWWPWCPCATNNRVGPHLNGLKGQPRGGKDKTGGENPVKMDHYK